MNHPKISYHGAHSGEFCEHAKVSTLEEVVLRYIELGFKNFGITEHQPREKACFLYPEEIQKNINTEHLFSTFDSYIKKARELQYKYKDKAEILLGFETEVCDENAFNLIRGLKEKYHVDYVVGSVHHVKGIPIDISQESYNLAIQKVGSIEELYLKYYDSQYELIKEIKPEIIGHFDLIKLFSLDFKISERILESIKRNIKLAVENGCIFEVNSRAFYKNLREPYPSDMVLKLIAEYGGMVTLGDDSHGVEQVGANLQKAFKFIERYFKEESLTCDGKFVVFK